MFYVDGMVCIYHAEWRGVGDIEVCLDSYNESQQNALVLKFI